MPAPRHLNEHSCLDLLEGLMPPSERDTLLDHIEECAACEDMLARWASHRERARARGVPASIHNLADHRSDLTPGDLSTRSEIPEGPEADEELDNTWTAPPPVQPHRSRSSWWTAGAAFAALLAVVILLPRDTAPPKGDEPESGVPALPGLQIELRLRATEMAPAEMQEGLAAYEAGELQRAVALLSATTTQEWEQSRLLYLGSAQARLGEHVSALATLDGLQFDALPDPWRGEALWTRYLCLVAVGSHDEARDLAEELALEPDAAGARAREALETP